MTKLMMKVRKTKKANSIRVARFASFLVGSRNYHTCSAIHAFHAHKVNYAKKAKTTKKVMWVRKADRTSVVWMHSIMNESIRINLSRVTKAYKAVMARSARAISAYLANVAEIANRALET